MLEQLRCHAYRNFWDAVPAMARGLEESEEVLFFQFTGSSTIGHHDAAFHSLLADRKTRRRLKVLLLSPLSLRDMTERAKTTDHKPEEYVRRILGTLEHLRRLRDSGSIQVEARLYPRDPLWYFWIFQDSIILYSHAFGIGRRSARVQLQEPGGGELRAVFTRLFESAWAEPGNRVVDFDRFDSDAEALTEEVRAALGSPSSGRAPEGAPWRPSVLPSPWNIRLETHPGAIGLLPVLRKEFETSSFSLYCGATGESGFRRKNADLAAAVRARGTAGRRIRISLIAPWSDEAVEDKVRLSTAGRTPAETRESIQGTLRVLSELKREGKLDIEARLRRELGTMRLFVFDRHVSFASFINAGPEDPSPWVLLGERDQDALVPFFRRRFEDSWEHAGSDPRGVVDLDHVVAVPRPEPPAEPQRRPAIVFDAGTWSLSIDGEQPKLARTTRFFLLTIASQHGGFVPLDQEVDGRPARRCRVDLGQAIGSETAEQVVETVRGIGYRFQPWVRVINAGGPRLRPTGELDV